MKGRQGAIVHAAATNMSTLWHILQEEPCRPRACRLPGKARVVAEPIKQVDIYHYNDLHRRLEPRDDGSGEAARLSSLIRQVRLENPDAVVVDGGNVAGDNAVPGPQAFDPMARILDGMGVDLLSLGNHEFQDPAGDYASLRNGPIEPFRCEVLCATVTHRSAGSA